MLKIVDVQTMQAIDQQATQDFGIPPLSLMEQAGACLAYHVRRAFSLDRGARVVVLAGRGKNGGDGLVCARYLAHHGIHVCVELLGSGPLAPETQFNLQQLNAENIDVRQPGDIFSFSSRNRLQQADVVVDALLGIGLKGGVREPLASAIHALNDTNALVAAADVPSGLDADTGVATEPAVHADLTITFGLPKKGLLYPAALPYVGQLVLETIGFPDQLLTADKEPMQYLDVRAAALALPRRPVDAHKRISGKVLIIGGSAAYHGAPLLASQGAIRAGAGFVSLAYPRCLETIIRSETREELSYPLAAAGGRLGIQALPLLLKLSQMQDAVVIGPGLGAAPATLSLIKRFLQQVKGPKAVVIDADALMPGLKLPVRRGTAAAPAMIITPHEGEAGRILRTTAEKIRNDRPAAARALAQQTRALVCLKGPHTLVAGQELPLLVIGAGTQALATAGTGDVLAGAIAGLSAQMDDPLQALSLGVFIHGWAGQLARADFFGIGSRAREVADKLPQAIRQIRFYHSRSLPEK